MIRNRCLTFLLVVAFLILAFSLASPSNVMAACIDTDGDGYGSPGDASCPKGNKTDCNNNDATVYPGAPKLCDGKDNNCDGIRDLSTDVDADLDGWPICVMPGKTKGDCNDNDPAINPAAPEICNGKDDDCNGILMGTERDSDKDGYRLCDAVPDCNDFDAMINPGVSEFCGDGKDNNCNGQKDEQPCICPDADNDGYTASYCGGTDCNDSNNTAYPGAPEICTDGIDNNCNGLIDWKDPSGINCPVCIDADNDGYAKEGGACGTVDCDDNDPKVYPGAFASFCDGKDTNCDGKADFSTDIDNDHDGFPVCALAGYSKGDCNDNNANINPGKWEGPYGEPSCSDGLDNNCNGKTDSADGNCSVPTCSINSNPKEGPHFFNLLNQDGSVHPDNGYLTCNKCHNPDNFQDNTKYQCKRCHAESSDLSDPLNGTIRDLYPANVPYGYGSAPVVKLHSSTIVGAKYGSWTMMCTTCHNPHPQEQNNAWGTSYGMYIKKYLCYDNNVTGQHVEKLIRFTAPTGLGSFADGAPYDKNVCEMCHTKTNHHRNDGTAPGDIVGGSYVGHYDGTKCTDCHAHVEGFKPACGACHGVPPATGTHAVHFGGTKDDAQYGSTSIAQDVSSQSAIYLMNCGNCHPIDGTKHMNNIPNSGGGAVEIELYNPNAPAGSLKAMNPPTATYTPGTTLYTDDKGMKYTTGTCSNVYCHSYTSFATSGNIPDPTPNTPGCKGNSCYPLIYNPPWESLVVMTRQYQTPRWGVDSLTCNGCHAYPPMTGASTVSAGAGDSHAWIDDFGYLDMHMWNMGFNPLQCNTCHYSTVRDNYTWTRDDFSIQLGNISIYNKAKHVNGSKDVAFTTIPVQYNTTPAPVYKDLNAAAFNANTKTCSNVQCHKGQTEVKWGTPYRWWNTYECNICHRM